MTTDTDTDSKKTTFQKIWPYIYMIILIIVTIVACVQLLLSIAFAVYVVVVAIFLYIKVYRKADALVHNSAFVFMDDLLGMGAVSEINEATGEMVIIVLALILFASCCLHISVKLYRGLQQEKPQHVIGYFMAGTVVLGLRVWNITAYEYHNFPEDKTVLYCGLYALYLVMVLIVFVEMYKVKKMQAELTETRTTLLRTLLVAIATRSRGGEPSTIPYAPV